MSELSSIRYFDSTRIVGLLTVSLAIAFFGTLFHVMETGGSCHPIWDDLLLPLGFTNLLGSLVGFYLCAKRQRLLVSLVVFVSGSMVALTLMTLLFKN